jgi:hypothetical protein
MNRQNNTQEIQHMAKLLQIDFPYAGSFGTDMAKELDGLAHAIAEEPGFIWKLWTENADTKEAGGVYLFTNEETALAYLEKHTARLKGFGIPTVNAKIFDINSPLSKITHGPLPS